MEFHCHCGFGGVEGSGDEGVSGGGVGGYATVFLTKIYVGDLNIVVTTGATQPISNNRKVFKS